MTITNVIVEKLVKTVDAGLCSGVGNPVPGEMCIMAAYAYALGQPHNDKPTDCTGSAVRNLFIPLNDSRWSSDAARANGLCKVSIAALGSNELNQTEFAKRLSQKTVQKLLPSVLREFSEVAYKKYKQPLLSIASSCEAATTNKKSDDSLARLSSLDSLARLYSLDSLASLASLARLARLDSLARLAGLASLDSLARLYSLDSLASDKFLSAIADCALEVLIEMKSPGCDFLHLCEQNGAEVPQEVVA